MYVEISKLSAKNFTKLTYNLSKPKLSRLNKTTMTNAHASKQHGLVGKTRPKSKLRKRKNKAKAKARKAAMLAARQK